MKFSLRELIFACMGIGGVLGMITNNYWMEREVKRTNYSWEVKYENLEHKYRANLREQNNLPNKYNNLMSAFEKSNPTAAKLYINSDECDCDDDGKALDELMKNHKLK